MPLPTYATLIPDVLQWAIDRNLIHPDGSANLATPQAQHAKTLEEIGEASDALETWQIAKAVPLDDWQQHINHNVWRCPEDYLAAIKKDAALELGDVLVTLVLQSSLQGVGFNHCRALSGTITQPVQTWAYVDCHARGLGAAVNNYSRRTPAFIGTVARCVEDVARIELSLTGPECLALALDKISGRRGQVVGGVFVKA